LDQLLDQSNFFRSWTQICNITLFNIIDYVISCGVWCCLCFGSRIAFGIISWRW